MARLIDTSVLIGIERRGGTIADLRRVVPDEQVAIASITASELLAGYLRSTSQRRRVERFEYVESIFSLVPVISFDLDIARVHARLRFDLESAGHRIGSSDLLIAATGLSLNVVVVTENRREFDRVLGLVVESPIWWDSESS